MEAIGIAASFIAIGQALLAGRHVVNLLQEIPKIGNELASLNNEIYQRIFPRIESLRAAVEAANSHGVIFPENEVEGPDLRLARAQITDIAKKLENVHLKCIQIGQNGKIKPKKTRWFLMQKELQQCRDKARDARLALQLALVAKGLRDTKQIARVALHIESLVLRPARHLDTSSPEALDAEISQEKDATSSTPAFDSGLGQRSTTIFVQDVETKMKQLSLPAADAQSTDRKSNAMDMIFFKARISSAKRCSPSCQCRCHVSQPASMSARYPKWIKDLAGSLSVTYDQRILFRSGGKCTEAACKGAAGSSATFDYQLPTWLCAYHVSVQAHVDSFRGLRCSMRSVRTVLLNDLTTLAIERHSRMAVRESMLVRGPLFPDDRDEVGNDVILNAIELGSADTLGFMVDFWADHLRRDTYDRNWFFAANREMRRHDCSAQKAKVLRLIASCGEDLVDTPQTKLHKAIDSDEPLHSIQSIVTEYPWTIDQWNREGVTPLALVVENGNLHAVRELVRLGCNIDQPDYEGVTPLMLACDTGHVDVVHFLLDAGCSVNKTDMFGQTAMYYAADPRSEPTDDPGSITQMLLDAGALAKAFCRRGNNPLHNMGSGCHDGKLTRRAAMIRIRLLLEAGADINALNYEGERPLDRAFFWEQPELVKCLIEAGAQITNLFEKQNLLHVAAGEARLETLQYLADMQLPLVNVCQKDNWGNTPWDVFIMSLNTPERDLGSGRRPDSQEKEAFVRLYKKLRDRSLELDISRLQRIRQHLEDGIHHGAMTVLESLIREKRDWEQRDLLRTYETIRLQVRERMVNAALESVDENIEVLQETIDESPWDQASRWDPYETEDADSLEDYTESEWTDAEDNVEGESNEPENDTSEPARDDD